MKILAGASVRRDPALLRAHLSTLAWQQLPEGVSVDLCHVDDLTPESRLEGKKALLEAGSNVLSGAEQVATIDFSDDAATHRWAPSAIERVAYNKQLIFDKAVREGYDYVWICDTDLLLDKRTLASMLAARKDIVAAVYWSRWQPFAPTQPQVWLNHPYNLAGRGLSAEEFMHSLASRQLVRVWGLGACMLVSTKVLQLGVRYHPLLPELVELGEQQGGMWAGEDRTFSVLAERARVELWADAWPDIFHVYRPEQAQQMEAWLDYFAAPKALRAQPGDLVSFTVQALEDESVPLQHIRGRLAALPLLPELEDTLLRLHPGEERLVRLHFPQHYPVGNYRGASRMVNVSLIDHKPFAHAPVLCDEVWAALPRETLREYHYTDEQLEQMREAAV